MIALRAGGRRSLALALALGIAGCASTPRSREDVRGAQRALARELVRQGDWERA